MNDSSKPASPPEPIETLDAIVGFFATEPRRNAGNDADIETESEAEQSDVDDIPKVFARFGVEHYSRNPDTGKIVRLEPTFHSLVAHWEAAEIIKKKFRKGDSFIAQGMVKVSKKTGKEYFEVKQIGHNTRRTRYEVDRSHRTRHLAEQRSTTDRASGVGQERAATSAVGSQHQPRRISPSSAVQTGIAR
ncbi:hypothetical protein [Leucobacter sp. NPDC077196]|uniref:hypothetical protein n=1 Tax=Leucobacter sp. NPDC077196 TaxID=3154959 RepID=UPI00342A74A8